MKRIEIFTAQIQEKTLPGWLRGKGYRLLIGEHLRHWGGPELPGEKVVHASSVHVGSSLESDGMTLWFLLPEGAAELFCPERLQQAAEYVFARLDRNAHTPKGGFNNVIFQSDAPPTNN